VVARNPEEAPFEAQLKRVCEPTLSELTEGLLTRENVFYEVSHGEFIVAGDDAQKFAENFTSIRAGPMVNGVITAMSRIAWVSFAGSSPSCLEGLPRWAKNPFPASRRRSRRRERRGYHELLFKEILAELGYGQAD